MTCGEEREREFRAILKILLSGYYRFLFRPLYDFLAVKESKNLEK